MLSFSTISPGMLRNVFIERCPRFSGFRQHDSHELIRSLLDCIKHEELIRWKKGILLKLNINTKDVRDDVKESVRNWGKAASTATIVDRLFGGVLISTIECCCCGTIRPRFEPFLDLSLSVTETDLSKHNGCESVSRHHSKDASRCTQLRKKERKRKTQKQRKYQSFTHDSRSDQEHMNHNSSDSDTERNGDGDQSIDTFIAKCCADMDDKRLDNEDVSRHVKENHTECGNNSNDDDDNNNNEAKLTNPDLKPTEASDLITSQVIKSGLEKLHLNSVAPSSQLLCNSDELSQAIHYARVPFNRSVNINTNEDATSIYQCLSKYTSAELLTGSNRLVCDVCTKRQTLSGKSLNSSSSMETTDDNMASDINNNDRSNLPVLQDVIKRDLIYRPPPILTIHLKRFQQVGVHLRKSQKSIKFPMYLDITPFCSILAVTLSSQICYRLYGVIEHTGHLASGHYVSYIAVSKSNTEHVNDPSTILENRFIGPLNRPPKWPLSVDDLIQRLRRYDHEQLLLALNHLTPIHNDEIINDSRQWFYCSDSHVTRVSPETVLNCQPYILFYERIE
ncbi:Ubiquitin carboxyl-terminal hydrolase 16 [Schistosoma japonicum]|nr:Ubiquitin carboxyl-terminal hydrolase 16 [Schistosoma japonicum]